MSASSGGVAKVDVSAFVIRLLLFDQYILQSNRLIEFTELVETLGYEALRDIFSCGAIKVHCEAYAVGQTGQTGLGLRGRKRDGTVKTLLPLNSYSFDIFMHTDKKNIIHQGLANIHFIEGIKQKQAIKLKGLIADNLVWLPEESTRNILFQLLADLRSQKTMIKRAISYRLQERFADATISDNDIELTIDVDEENDVRVFSNLNKLYSLDDKETHDIVSEGLMAIGGLNTRIETMRAFSALSGFKHADLPLFEDKLSFITASIDPAVREGRARKILAWPELPDLAAAISNKRVHMDRLLELRESTECADFRNWLWSTDDLADEELHERVRSLFSRISLALSTTQGRTLRWLTMTGIGLVPGAGQLLGPVMGLLDTFVVDKLMHNDGVVTFLGRTYPSIFEGT